MTELPPEGRTPGASSTALQIGANIRIAWSDLDITYSRSSGPGGQNVNKVNSKVQIQWNPSRLPDAVRERFLVKFGSRLQTDGELLIASQKFRDQHRNLEDCLSKLREMIQSVLIAPRVRRPTKPTRGSIERRIEAKKQQSQRKSSRRQRDFDS
jgi:ribosome-associated protein